MVHTDSISIVFDSGCSVALIPCKKDFQGTLVKIDNIIQDIGSSTQVHEEGVVSWLFKDDYGVT